MCIIAVIPKDKKITADQIRECSKSNPDGFGLSFVSGGEFIVRKTMKGLASEKKLISWAEKRRGDSDLILHWRIATHGGTNLANCHPFPIGEHLIGAHNGMLNVLLDDSVSYQTEGRSDTRIFFAEYLAKLPVGWQNEQYLLDLVSDYIAGSKIAVIDRIGRATVVRRGDGVEQGGIWFSNNTFRSFYQTTFKGYTGPPVIYATGDTSKYYQKGYRWDQKAQIYVLDGAKPLIQTSIPALSSAPKCLDCQAVLTDADPHSSLEMCARCAVEYGQCVACGVMGEYQGGLCSTCVQDWSNFDDQRGADGVDLRDASKDIPGGGY